MRSTLLAVGLCITPLAAQDGIGVRILLGIKDTEPVKWDGSVTARGAEVRAIEPWRFDEGDSIDGTRWIVSTHAARLFNNGSQIGLPRAPVVANGVIVRVTRPTPNADLQVTTAQGNFTVALREIPYGKSVSELNGRVSVDLIPPVEQITNDPREQDYPAAATAKDGTIWLAYAEFIHNTEHDRLRANMRAAPPDFKGYSAPTGGDRVLARSYRNGAWSEPIVIRAAGSDVNRPAIALDGRGRTWVFWSENNKGNFDIWARPIENGKPGSFQQITTAAGTDMDPVAATDSAGTVWVAWQAWRNGHASILYSKQGNRLFAPGGIAVAPSTGNQWNPAIAADTKGRVTVAWDTYQNGNYDVMLRTAVSGAWGQVVPVAASARYEAYPSIAYDSAGRLWVAYEEGANGWGKDFGAQSSKGIALYQGRAVRLRGFEPNGSAIRLKEDPGRIMTGAMALEMNTGHQNDSEDWLSADPKRAEQRPRNRSTENLFAPKNTSPRLAIDPSGRIWLAYRSVNPVWWNPLGTVWFEYVVSYDGSQWTGPVFLSHSDNLLDNRPALVSTQAGALTIIGSSDSRQQFVLALRHGSQAMDAGVATLVSIPVQDPYNNDLFANTISLGPATRQPETIAEAPPVTAVEPEMKAERDAIARIRAWRGTYEGQNLRLARGEFHRHSEISMDGGLDGSILDQWRYVLDAVDLDWVGCCDHDNGGGREYTWWLTQKETDLFYSPGRFAPLFSYERSVAYPEGHRNVLFVQRGVRTLPRLPKMADNSSGRAPDTQMFYNYLKAFHGVTASHTSATSMGTDWRDNDPEVETSVEIYQGDRQNYEKPGAPRSSTPEDSIGGYRPKGYVDLALEMGYKMAFESSSDHVSTHMSFANVLTTAITREAILDGFRKRHLYAATDNILAEFTSGPHIMGDIFSTAVRPAFKVRLVGTAPFAKVVIVKDNQYVYSQEPNTAEVSFTWRDASPSSAKSSYYYVRGEQADGEIVWVSPMWVTYTGK